MRSRSIVEAAQLALCRGAEGFRVLGSEGLGFVSERASKNMLLGEPLHFTSACCRTQAETAWPWSPMSKVKNVALMPVPTLGCER